jgi:hypothetical protein
MVSSNRNFSCLTSGNMLYFKGLLSFGGLRSSRANATQGRVKQVVTRRTRIRLQGIHGRCWLDIYGRRVSLAQLFLLSVLKHIDACACFQ